MQIVKPAELPNLALEINIRTAARRLGPEDAVDERARVGDATEADLVVLAQRQAAIMGAVERCAAAAGVSGEVLREVLALAPEKVDAWLLASGLTKRHGEILVEAEGKKAQKRPVVRPETGNPQRKAVYYAALARKAEYPSRAAAMLRQVAQVAAGVVERANGREGGAAHAMLVGLIGLPAVV